MEHLLIKNLSFTYPSDQSPAIKDINLTIERGELLTICGATGSGKSTLLRLLQPALLQNGAMTGAVLINGKPLSEVSPGRIGYVMQDAMGQIVTDKVYHELAFGLENLGAPRREIARRIAETAAYFGIESWYERSTHELSGGQAQLLNLASVMVTDPEILILDEPTAQLDPIAASSFLDAVKKLKREMGLTIIITEHRLGELIPVSSRIAVLKDGCILLTDTPRAVAETLTEGSELLPYMPAPVQLYHRTGSKGACPLSLREGREYIVQNYHDRSTRVELPEREQRSQPALEFKDVCFRYDRRSPDALSDMTLTVYENEVCAIVGANGAGKSTALLCAAGLLRPYNGSVRVFGKKVVDYKGGALYRNCVSLLPQDVNTVFLHNTVERELRDCKEGEALLPFDLSPLYERHPYDLSGGEKQLVALARVLGNAPRLLLMDEPTKGLDAAAKQRLLTVIRTLKESGVTVCMVTHDVEFAATAADRCAMLFRGGCVSVDDANPFFSKNSFYTTGVSRMTRGVYENTVTLDELLALLEKNGRRDLL